MQYRIASLLFVLLAGCNPPADTAVDPPAGTSVAPAEDAVRVVAGPITCEDPAARDLLGPFERAGFPVGEFYEDGERVNEAMGLGARGLIVADFDDDGLLDMVAPRVTLPAAWVATQPGGTLTLVPPQHEDIIGPFGGSAADVDGDGDPDMIFYSQTQAPQLYLNDGTGYFNQAYVPAFEEAYLGCGRTASWGDVDLDGDLDLYYGRSVRGVEKEHCGSSLYLGDGEGGFEDASHLLPPEAINFKTVASGFHQMDDDLWPELFIVTGLGEVNTGFDHGPDGFTKLENTGLEAPVDSMGIAAADLNLDGVTDFAIAGIDQIVVLVSVGGEKVWVNNSLAWGLFPGEDSHVAWGGDFADLDNDGLYDMVMGFGSTYLGAPPDYDEIYRGLTPTSFERVGEAWGFNDGFSTRGSVIADLDGDGWLDIVKRQVAGIAAVYTARCGASQWLSVRLRGTPPNVDAVGAWIEVTADDARYTRSVSLGSTGFSTGGPPDLHVGLGEAEEIDEIVVHWPDGTITTHGPISTNTKIEILHPDLL